MSRLLSKAVIKIVIAKKIKIVTQVLFILLGREENFNSKNVNEVKIPNEATKLLLANRWKFLPINCMFSPLKNLNENLTTCR